MAGISRRFAPSALLCVLAAITLVLPRAKAQRVLVEIDGGPVIGVQADALTRLDEYRSGSTLPPAEFGHGRRATQEEIAAWDTDIMPDGDGLPGGSGNAAEGARLYAVQCASCHGVNGEGNRPLGGPLVRRAVPGRTLGDYWPFATTVYDYVQKTMPFSSPGSLTSDEVYSLTAWLLFRNGIISENTELDADSLATVVMPNVDGFELDAREAYRIVR